MAQTHATFGEVIAAGPLGEQWSAGRSQTLVREHALQISRLVLPRGHTLKPHAVSLILVFQCLEGEILFETMGRQLTLNPGDLCHINPGEKHSVSALKDSSALLTLFGMHPLLPDESADNP